MFGRQPEPDARIAMVAIQLGLHEDAERLYLECKVGAAAAALPITLC